MKRIAIGISAALCLIICTACIPDLSGVERLRERQIQTTPSQQTELAASSELVYWAIEIDGIPDRRELTLHDAQSVYPATRTLSFDNEAVKYDGARLSDLIKAMNIGQYGGILIIGENNASKDIDAHANTHQMIVAWMQDGLSLHSPILITEQGIELIGVTRIIIE